MANLPTIQQFSEKISQISEKISQISEKITNPPILDKHILASYSALRGWMGFLALILPVLLVVGGIKGLWLKAPLEIQNSLSAYYHAGSTCAASDGVYRDLFVGILAAISFCLIIYTGFSRLENWLLNFAGVFLACVAFFPMSWPESQILSVCQVTPGFEQFTSNKLLGLSIHDTLALVFFLIITWVNVFTAMDTVNVIEDREKRKFWKNIFKIARFLMPISLGIVLLLRFFTDKSIIGERFILWLEWAGIWAFSFYWLLKSLEIMKTKVDVDTIKGNVQWENSSSPSPNENLSRRRSSVKSSQRQLVRVDPNRDT